MSISLIEPSALARAISVIATLASAETCPGGRAAVRARLSPGAADRLAPLFEGHFVAGIYDEVFGIDVLVDLMSSVATLRETSLAVHAERSASAMAAADIRRLFGRTSPGEPALVAALPWLFGQYFSGVRATIDLHESGQLLGRLDGVPRPQFVFFEAVNRGFVEGALRLAGARGIEFSSQPQENALDGSFAFRATWTTENRA